MKRLYVVLAAVGVLAAVMVAVSSPLRAQEADREGRRGGFTARLEGFQEVPAISTTGRGEFRARLTGATTLEFELSYSGLEASVLFAHIHFGQRGVNGGVVAFLCGGGGKPACPASGSISGTVTAADVTGPAAQGIGAGEFAEFVRALRESVTYANVHTSKFPSGEIRGQINDRGERE